MYKVHSPTVTCSNSSRSYANLRAAHCFFCNKLSSRNWHFCFIVSKTLNYLAFQSFDFELTWWRFFQKDVVRTNCDFYVLYSIDQSVSSSSRVLSFDTQRLGRLIADWSVEHINPDLIISLYSIAYVDGLVWFVYVA
jgi:hypothetical protein